MFYLKRVSRKLDKYIENKNERKSTKLETKILKKYYFK